MELNIPSNYLPQGRPEIEEGFGYKTNKNQYKWLQEHSINESRYQDILSKVDPASRDNIKRQKERIKANEDILDYFNRVMSKRQYKELGIDPYTDESSHQTILKFQL